MKIIVDNKQEKELIMSMCNVALRTGGIQNLDEVNKIVAAIEMKTKKE